MDELKIETQRKNVLEIVLRKEKGKQKGRIFFFIVLILLVFLLPPPLLPLLPLSLPLPL